MAAINTLLLAAGKSTRIMEFSKGVPKPLIPIDGDSIIFRNLRWLSQYQFIDDVWINLHYQHAHVKNTLQDFSKNIPKLKLQFIHEENILGTAGALSNVSTHWPSDLHSLVVYGDNLFNFDLNAFIHAHFSNNHLATIALFDKQKNQHTGIAGGSVLLDRQGRIRSFLEGGNPSSPYVNAGVYLFAPSIIKKIPAEKFYDFGNDFFPRLLDENMPLYGHIIDGYCLGLDTPECFVAANQLIQQHKVTLL